MKKFKIIFILLIIFSINYGQDRYLLKFDKKSKIQLRELKQIIQNNISNNVVNNVNKQLIEFKFNKHLSDYGKYFFLETNKNINLSEIEHSLSKNTELLSVEKLTEFQTHEIIPNDIEYINQWGLEKAKFHLAWEHEVGNNDIKIGLVDTGIDYLHEDLQNCIDYNYGEFGIDINGNNKESNGIDDDNNGFIDDYLGWNFVDNSLNGSNPTDDQGHGTSVAGVIGASSNNGIGITGINWNSKIIIAKAFNKYGYGKEEDVSAALLYSFIRGARIINMSFGDVSYSILFKDVIDFLINNNVLLVASAGNSGSDNPHYPSAFPFVISVGASDINDNLSSFSNFGNTIDLLAPGSEILTTSIQDDVKYNLVSGTSIAAPFVTGLASLLLSRKNNLSINDLTQILKTTADDLYSEGFDYYSGSGRINALKAVLANSLQKIQINYPLNTSAFSDTTFSVIITVISPNFKNYEIQLSQSSETENWETIFSSNYQIIDSNVCDINTTLLSEGLYTIKLVVFNYDGTSSEERVQFEIIKSAPMTEWYLFSTAFENGNPTISFNLGFNQFCTSEVLFDVFPFDNQFEKFYLDNLSRNIGDYKDVHSGSLPNILDGSSKIKFKIFSKNRANLTNYFPENNYEIFELGKTPLNLIPSETSSKIYGDIYPKFYIKDSTPYLLVNEYDSFNDLKIYEFNEIRELTLVKTVGNRRIPRIIYDINSDGKNEIISFSYPNLYIDSEMEQNSINWENVISFNIIPNILLIADIDFDNKLEIVSTLQDSLIQIFEIDSSFKLNIEATLKNKTQYFDINNSPNKIITNETSLVNGAFYLIDYEGDILKIESDVPNTYSINSVANFPILFEEAIIKNDFENNLYVQGIVNSEIFTQNQGFLLKYALEDTLQLIDIKSLIDNRETSLTTNNTLQIVDSLILSSIFNDFYLISTKTDVILDYTDNKNTNAPTKFLLSDSLNGTLFFTKPDELSNKQQVVKLDDNTTELPLVKELFSDDSNFVSITLDKITENTKLYKSLDSLNFVHITNLTQTTYIDSNVSYGKIWYKISVINQLGNEIFSKPFEVFVHQKVKIMQVKQLTKNSVEIKFSDKINTNYHYAPEHYFKINNDIFPTSLIPNSQNSILLNFEIDLTLGTTYQLTTENIYDFWNSPIEDSTFLFEGNYVPAEKQFFISNFTQDKNSNVVSISFNLPFDESTILDLGNYSITPQNKILRIDLKSQNQIEIEFENQIGLGASAYQLEISNIYSTVETGSIKLNNDEGNKIYLVSTENNLENEYVYPNPINLSIHNKMVFGNLTKHFGISIYDINMNLIKKINNPETLGYYIWDLKNQKNEIISSGVYIYKVNSMNDQGEIIETKTNKFAIVK